MAMTKAEKARMAALECAAADAIYALDGIADLYGFGGNFENCDPLCGHEICNECGCIDHKRHDARRALLPKTIEDFGYSDYSERG